MWAIDNLYYTANKLFYNKKRDIILLLILKTWISTVVFSSHIFNDILVIHFDVSIDNYIEKKNTPILDSSHEPFFVKYNIIYVKVQKF